VSARETMFDPILRAVGAFLAWIDSWAGNYMVALLIFTVVLELIFLPFAIKQQKNSIRQATLRPKEMAIRNKYKGRNDKVTQQKVMTEIQELYQKENYSQFSGCLPMLLQMLALILIYSVVSNPLKFVVGLDGDTINTLSQAILGTDGTNQTIGLLTKIQTLGIDQLKAMNIDEVAFGALEAKFDMLPDFTMFGGKMNLGDTPSIKQFNLLLTIPAITFISYFFSTKLTRKLTYQPVMSADQQQMGCSNKVMDIIMPLFSLFIAFTVPAALGVYWIFKSILGTVKQYVIFKAMPLPVFTEEDYKAAERELKGKSPAPDREIPANVKSLCREDEDDDEPYPTFVGVKGGRYDDDPEEKPKESAEDKDLGKMGKKLDAAPLKDDDKTDKPEENE